MSQSTKMVEYDDLILVTWVGEDDPESSYSWSLEYTALFATQISLFTAFFHMSSAIYTPGVQQIMEDMKILHHYL